MDSDLKTNKKAKIKVLQYFCCLLRFENEYGVWFLLDTIWREL